MRENNATKNNHNFNYSPAIFDNHCTECPASNIFIVSLGSNASAHCYVVCNICSWYYYRDGGGFNFPEKIRKYKQYQKGKIMNTGFILTIVALLSFIVLLYVFIKQLMKMVVLMLAMFIIFAGYLYVKNGSLPKSLQGYLDEGKIGIEQLQHTYKKLTE